MAALWLPRNIDFFGKLSRLAMAISVVKSHIWSSYLSFLLHIFAASLLLLTTCASAQAFSGAFNLLSSFVLYPGFIYLSYLFACFSSCGFGSSKYLLFISIAIVIFLFLLFS